MSGWDTLAGIVRESRAIAERERVAGPVECEVDGEPLRRGPELDLYCPFCGRLY